MKKLFALEKNIICAKMTRFLNIQEKPLFDFTRLCSQAVKRIFPFVKQLQMSPLKNVSFRRVIEK